MTVIGIFVGDKIKNVDDFHYSVFGINIQSEIEIPGLRPAQTTNSEVEIHYGPTPDHLSEIISSGVLFESSKDEFLLKLPRVGSYYVKDGDQITIDPKPGTSKDEIRLFLLGSVFGALLFQRGITPIHGSAVKIHDKALMIIGNSASGKSTLAASLALSGYPLISDDLSAISYKSGKCVILPGIPVMKLWADSKEMLFPSTAFERVRPQINKFSIPSIPRFEAFNELEVGTILNLQTKNSDGYKWEKLIGAHKITVIRNHLFRDQIMAGMAVANHHFKILSALAMQSNIFNVQRPSIPLNIGSLKNFVLRELEK